MSRVKRSLALSAVTMGLAMLVPCENARGAVITGSSGALNGQPVTTFVETNASNQLSAVGFQVSGAAVRNPGTGPADVFLTLPSQASGTGFTTLAVDWNPQGHPPPGIYDVPHFDFHFYYIPDSFRATIPGGQVSPVAPQFLPAGYDQPGPTVPMMGGHASDLTSPEFNGQKFTQTFIYGYYNGQEIFLEPMASQAYLEGLAGSTTSTDNFTVRQPSQYGLASLPSLVPSTIQYAYNQSDDLYTISVGGFITPTATPEPGSLFLLAIGIPAAALIASRRAKLL